MLEETDVRAVALSLVLSLDPSNTMRPRKPVNIHAEHARSSSRQYSFISAERQVIEQAMELLIVLLLFASDESTKSCLLPPAHPALDRWLSRT